MYDLAQMPISSFVEGEFDRMPPHFAKTRQPKPDFSEYNEPGGSGLHGFIPICTAKRCRRSIASYYGMISLIDHQVRGISSMLWIGWGWRRTQLLSTPPTAGHFIGQHGLIAKGAFHYEDVLRVPMLVRYPGKVAAGAVSDSLQSLVDYPQTFLAAAGIEAPGAMQGVDQLPVWQGESERARDYALVENRHNPTKVHLRTLITER